MSTSFAIDSGSGKRLPNELFLQSQDGGGGYHQTAPVGGSKVGVQKLTHSDASEIFVNIGSGNIFAWWHQNIPWNNVNYQQWDPLILFSGSVRLNTRDINHQVVFEIFAFEGMAISSREQ